MSAVVKRGLLLVLLLSVPAMAGCLGDAAQPEPAEDGQAADTDDATTGADAGANAGDGAAAATTEDPHAHHGGGQTMVLAETEWRSAVPLTLPAAETMATVSEFDVPEGLLQLELNIERDHGGPEVSAAAIEVFRGDDSVTKKEFCGSGPSPTGSTQTLTITIDDPQPGAYSIGYHIDTIDRYFEHVVKVTALGHMG